ncbi:GCN5 family acetyltransferase [Orenia metallireducens]|jgi:phosphinothricin acetyltransferase|uniref:GCN5 family acetyltransferase n=1 Tax=Orenia metallireducens TaxID=1413210 RepID=A0A1C0A806_9FIRM|nr:GNAT family N-acetyltransferase [Orenia metallireducens]OCL26389.1 GCN5 family acetyltransferase [Orenia metallireducens]
MKIRRAEIKDLGRITEIYNDAILNTTATFDIEIKTVDSRREWFDCHNEKLPIYVAEKDEVMGWVSLSKLFNKGAYAATVEISIYVDKKYRNRGVANALMKKIVSHAIENEEIHTVIARITGENKTSIHLHQKFGFEFAGTLKEVGYKFDRYIDVHLYQLLV